MERHSEGFEAIRPNLKDVLLFVCTFVKGQVLLHSINVLIIILVIMNTAYLSSTVMYCTVLQNS